MSELLTNKVNFNDNDNEVNHSESLMMKTLSLLTSNNLMIKVEIAKDIHKKWNKNLLPIGSCISKTEVPDEPSRPESISSEEIEIKKNELLKIKSRKEMNLCQMMHGIAHAESYAIDLFADLIVRFGGDECNLPKSFYDDFVEVLEQEARHFRVWKERLDHLNCPYGSLNTHDGLWRAAYDSRNDILDRLAVVNMVHEARGLDTYTASKKKLVNWDPDSVKTLDCNFGEEIEHVRKGCTWFSRICEMRELEPKKVFQEIVTKFFTLPLKGPFNYDARTKAGFSKDWYEFTVNDSNCD